MFLGNQYLRQPLELNSLSLDPQSLQNGRNIFSAWQALPCAMADLGRPTWDGFAPHFARLRDVNGESLEGSGSMSVPDPEAEQLPEDNLVSPPLDGMADYGVPCSVKLGDDRNGAILLRQSAGADRLRAKQARPPLAPSTSRCRSRSASGRLSGLRSSEGSSGTIPNPLPNPILI